MQMSIKRIITLASIGVVALISIIIFMTSWVDVPQGSEGFMYQPYSGGVQQNKTYTEGTYFVAPWNEMVSYNTRQQSRTYQSQVMDKNGTDITIAIAINYSPIKGQTPKLHLKHGPAVEVHEEETGKLIEVTGGYVNFIDDKVKGAIKDVVGRYTYEEVYSTKREALEGEIESILNKDFNGNFVQLHYVEIADVNLPGGIQNEITAKETQKQKNMKSELMKIEEKNLADARIEKSRGDSSLVISAQFKAMAIKKEAEQLKANPSYIEYIKWKGYADGKGSPYGEGNVFGSGTAIIKEIK
jgi:regulator of protease activity HflC (stomatin/prohibitin superfamily)